MSNNCRSNGSQYHPYMFGGSSGFGVQQTGACPTMSTAAPRAQEVRVSDCMFWPSSVSGYSGGRNVPGNQFQPPMYYKEPQTARGDSPHQFCSAPPKIFLSTPGMDTPFSPQNLPMHVAPLGTDPMSMIQPLAPIQVNMRAPANLFSGDPKVPKTITIDPSQLYGFTLNPNGAGNSNGRPRMCRR